MNQRDTTLDITPSTPVKQLPGIGSKRAAALARLDIHTVGDLLRHLPMRYERHFAEGNIADLPAPGNIGSARGTIVATRWMPSMGRGKARFEATLQDHSDRVKLVWFNGSYLRDKLHAGMLVRVQGKVDYFAGYAQMVNPKWELLQLEKEPAAHVDRLRPVYPASEDLPSTIIEKLVAEVLPVVLPKLTDPLPIELMRDHAMPVLADAFRGAHTPLKDADAQAARRRLAFNELLLLQMGMALKRHHNRTALHSPAMRWTSAIDTHLRRRFPFALTGAQNRVIGEISSDLQQTVPMNRLLQGDVGSGKTVVALYALLMAVANRLQGAIMTPTELLAEQHFASISRMMEGSNVRMELLTGGRYTAKERNQVNQRIAAGEVDLVIGTQALLTESVRFANLAVVVIDEQHRFGVLQRAAFKQNGGMTPHYLVMTATPIPRTLSLTIFGDLDVSVIDELPPGRSPIITKIVAPEQSDKVYDYLVQRVTAGEQAYVVVPTIDAAGHESAAPLKDLQTHVKWLREKYGASLSVEMVHGRQERDTREAIMQRFRDGQVQVLVATTVIEVGVDVPNATMMVVEHAERFGLAQLHQLRGRIGRGTHGRQSVCALIGQPVTPEADQRLGVMRETTDGFRIAQADLDIRGMGDFFGTRQHGLPPLRVARIPEDMALLNLAQRDAQSIVTNDPTLTQPEHALLRQVLLQQYGDTLGLIDVG